MALGSTNISTAAVRSALGASNNNLFSLGTSSLLNMWSKYKPVRGTWPHNVESGHGRYGLDWPIQGTRWGNWLYLKPRGGSPGGSPDEPVRLGDFRGYEHNKDLAGPVIWALQSGISLKTPHKPDTAGQNAGYFTFRMNTGSAVKIAPSDLGLEGYYWCLRITKPNYSVYYKTLEAVLADVATIPIDTSLVMTVPTSPAYSDFPYAVGTFYYELCLASSIAAGWTATPPGTVIRLPYGTFGSKTIVCDGYVTVNNWYWSSNTNMEFEYNETAYKSATIRCSGSQWVLESKPSWITVEVYNGAVKITNPAFWASGMELRATASTNTGSARSGHIYIGYGSGQNVDIEVSQGAATVQPVVDIEVVEGETWTVENESGSVGIGSSILSITFTPVGFSAGGQTIYATAYKGGSPVGSKATWGRNTYETNDTITLDDPAESGDEYTIVLSEFEIA